MCVKVVHKQIMLTSIIIMMTFFALPSIDALAASKPTEADARLLFQNNWGYAAKKKFFAVSDVKKSNGQMLTVEGVKLYKMYVNVTLQTIWPVVVCQRSNPFDNSTDSLHMMRDGDYKKLTDGERTVFTGHNLGSLASCKPKGFGEREKFTIKRTLIYEEFENGWELSNLPQVIQLELHEKYLVGDEADDEISRMDGLQGLVARAVTGVKKREGYAQVECLNYDELQKTVNNNYLCEASKETTCDSSAQAAFICADKKKAVKIKQEKGEKRKIYRVKRDTILTAKPGFAGGTLSILAGQNAVEVPGEWEVEYIGKDDKTDDVQVKLPTGKIGWIGSSFLEGFKQEGKANGAVKSTPIGEELTRTSKNMVYHITNKNNAE